MCAGPFKFWNQSSVFILEVKAPGLTRKLHDLTSTGVGHTSWLLFAFITDSSDMMDIRCSIRVRRMTET